MASKYAALKGKIPKEPTERNIKITQEMGKRKEKAFAELAAEFNKVELIISKLKGKQAEMALKLNAISALMEDKLEAEDADNITTQGRTWGMSYEPYPSAEDPEAIVKYFNENGMAAQLVLNKTELAARLVTFVKEEAANNELIIETETVEGPDGPIEKQVVKSKIPGVKVFLWSGLSKAKARVAK
jgi:hypothetical protein